MQLFPIMVFCSIIFAFTAHAEEGDFSGSIEIQKNDPIVKSVVNKEVSLYNFSIDLLNAAENCSAYSEDFAQNNPDIKAMMKEMFGNADFTVPVEIFGKEDNLCHFTVGYKLNGIGGSMYDCKITEEQRNELLEAMKSRTLDTMTDTFTTAPTAENPMAVETTMTAGKFDVILAKLQATACNLQDEQPSKEEVAAARQKFEQLPDEFMNALSECKPAEVTQTIIFAGQTAKIIGWDNDKCHIAYNDFDLYIPRDQLRTILTYGDLEQICANPEIATYNYKKNYNYDDLMTSLASCYKNTSSPWSAYMSSESGDIKTKSGMEVFYQNNSCILTFVNEVTVKDNPKDYGVICTVSEAEIAEILEPYRPLLEKYGNKETKNDDGSVSFKSAQSNKETKNADARVMYQLQVRNLCKMKNN